jgi:hypothetical protein
VKTPKLISISLVGLVLNALFNGVFILLIARESDSQILAQSMVIWSGFFVAGACIAPFENYFLYQRIGNAQNVRHGKVILLSSTVFLIVGLSIYLSQGLSVLTIPLTLTAGFCTGHMVHLRAKAISQGLLFRVSLSNSMEGFARAAVLFFCTNQIENLSSLQILLSYIAGTLVSLLPYLQLKNKREIKVPETIPNLKLYGLAIIGLLTSLTTGGLPYLAGYFDATSISIILFFFTLSRSLLIIQSILVYVKPQIAKDLGEAISSRTLLRYSIPLIAINFSLLLLLKHSVETILDINLSSIDQKDLFLYASSLVTSAFFALKIATKNASAQWGYAVTSGVFALLVACLSFVLIGTGTNAFHTAMILAPLTGILTLIQLDKRREISE